MRGSAVAVFLVALLAAAPLRAADFRDPNLPPEMRAADLVSKLTLAERISLMGQNQPAVPRLGIAARRFLADRARGRPSY